MSFLLATVALLISLMCLWILYEISKNVNRLQNDINQIQEEIRRIGSTATPTGPSSIDGVIWIATMKDGRTVNVTAQTEGEAVGHLLRKGIDTRKVVHLRPL